MGNFYTNITVKGVAPEHVTDALAGRTAFVSRLLDDAVIVADEQCEEQLTVAVGFYLLLDPRRSAEQRLLRRQVLDR